jgi:hypothetical protein
MKDQAAVAALDVNGPAVVAAFAAVGDQRILVLLSLTGRLEVCHGALQAYQVGGHLG